MVIHAGSNGNRDGTTQGCERGLHRAFSSPDTAFREDYQNGTSLETDSMVNFKGYIDNSTNSVVAKNLSDIEDEYEALAKAIEIYNGAKEWMLNYSWPRIIRYLKYDPASKENITEKDICHSCKYSIEVRSNENVFGMNNLRTYVWVGGTGVDLNNNQTTDDIIPENPTANPPTVEINEAEVLWCFAYGEREWVREVSFVTAKEQTERYINNRQRDGDTNYKADCP